jgi:hypothetical protein
LEAVREVGGRFSEEGFAGEAGLLGERPAERQIVRA